MTIAMQDVDTDIIKVNLEHIKQQITRAEREFDREQGSVQLLAASKGQSIEKLSAAYRAGQYAFGENYLQEALIKIAALSQITGKNTIEWHFIGPVQSNKTKKIAEHFAWVHSITNEKIAQRLNDQRPPHLPPLNICIEVNVSHETSKTGSHNVLQLVEYCESLPHLHLRGLMTIPAPQKDFAAARIEFHKLARLFHMLQEKGHPLDTLSMGMSDDFQAAIAEGATIVRIGTSIFGQRTKSPILP